MKALTSWKLPWEVSTPFACLTVGKGASGWDGSSGQGGAAGIVQLGGTCSHRGTSHPRTDMRHAEALLKRYPAIFFSIFPE